ncbi:hypothetical protein diail_7782 [Diaporthe ilicicola]|nr:hypothetical protein diail_7782 [Diaporthe ilicicola]
MRVRLFMSGHSSAPGSGYNTGSPGLDSNEDQEGSGAGADEAKARQREEDARRNEYFNQLQLASGSVRTLCRIRPRNDKEAADDERMADMNAAGSRVSLPNKLDVMTDYEFNHAFGPEAADASVLDRAWESIEKALGGTDTSVIFYGQTGSGKSYLMDKLIKRMSTVLFDGKGTPTRPLSGSWVEVYRDRVKDLLASSVTAGEVKLERNGRTWKLSASWHKLDRLKVLQDVQERAERRRTTTKTKVNKKSSRSHSIFTLLISGLGGRGDATRLQLVDLDGSEEIDTGGGGLGDKDQADQWRQQAEARAIKISLTNIGKLVRHAEEAKRRKLRAGASTTVFQDSLTKIIGPTVVGSGAETLMIFTLSPLEAHREKSLHTLLLADEVLGVYLKKARGRVAAK